MSSEHTGGQETESTPTRPKITEDGAFRAMLTDAAIDAWNGYRDSRSSCRAFKRKMRWIRRAVDDLGLDPDEIGTVELLIICDDSEDRPDHAELVEQANSLVQLAYESNKYAGRDAEAFFRKVFGMVSHDLELTFSESR
jgi:hypothetical protein